VHADYPEYFDRIPIDPVVFWTGDRFAGEGAMSNGGAKKRWPTEVRTSALERAAVVGPSRAADELGVPLETVKSWMQRESKRAHAELARADLVLPVRVGMSWAERRARLLPMIGELCEESVAAARLAVQEGRSRAAADFALVASRMADRAAVLSGDVTSRSESRSLQVRAQTKDVELEREIAELTEEVQGVLDRKERRELS